MISRIELDLSDVKYVDSFNPPATLSYLNNRIQEKLKQRCRSRGHVAEIERVATVTPNSIESEWRQWGLVCGRCGVELICTQAVEKS